jgi:hypothetical protein
MTSGFAGLLYWRMPVSSGGDKLLDAGIYPWVENSNIIHQRGKGPQGCHMSTRQSWKYSEFQLKTGILY